MSSSALKMPLVDVFVRRSVATDIALISVSVALLSVAAQVKVLTVPVPVTLQTLVVLLLGAVLGTQRGVIAATSYLAIGAIGLPVFSGAQTLTGAIHTAGYLVGFIFATAVVGWFADRGLLKNARWTIVAFSAASILIYIFGVAGLMLSPLQLSLETAFAAGVAPFLGFDALKAATAAAIMPIAWKFSAR